MKKLYESDKFFVFIVILATGLLIFNAYMVMGSIAGAFLLLGASLVGFLFTMLIMLILLVISKAMTALYNWFNP